MDIFSGSGVTGCFSKAGLKIATGSKLGVGLGAPNGAGTDYAINGIAYHKADAAEFSFTAAATQAAGTSCLYLVQIDAAGTVSSVKGEEVATSGETVPSSGLQCPMPSQDNCPLGYVRIDTSSSVTFTAGTTALDAAGITDTYVDFIGGLPGRPVAS